jgi:alpha-glucosidase
MYIDKPKNMTKRIFISLYLTLIITYAFSQNFEINSPDERIKLAVSIESGISWSALLNENPIIENADIGMDFSTGSDFGSSSTVENHSIEKISSKIYPVISQFLKKNNEILN